MRAIGKHGRPFAVGRRSISVCAGSVSDDPDVLTKSVAGPWWSPETDWDMSTLAGEGWSSVPDGLFARPLFKCGAMQFGSNGLPRQQEHPERKTPELKH